VVVRDACLLNELVGRSKSCPFFPSTTQILRAPTRSQALSDVLRVEMNPFNVSVSVVEPAYVATEIFGKIIKETEEIIDEEARTIYGPLFYRPEQAAKRAAQVAKADSPLVTSEAIEHALFDEHPRTRYVVANFDGLPGACVMCLQDVRRWIRLGGRGGGGRG
jgi:putative ubiquitin-RnfH superfamily antitoxin RatB of RatAB toxin-antitoxin module